MADETTIRHGADKYEIQLLRDGQCPKCDSALDANVQRDIWVCPKCGALWRALERWEGVE